jgi:catechol-2,3-dioxygenase
MAVFISIARYHLVFTYNHWQNIGINTVTSSENISPYFIIKPRSKVANLAPKYRLSSPVKQLMGVISRMKLSTILVSTSYNL